MTTNTPLLEALHEALVGLSRVDCLKALVRCEDPNVAAYIHRAMDARDGALRALEEAVRALGA